MRLFLSSMCLLLIIAGCQSDQYVNTAPKSSVTYYNSDGFKFGIEFYHPNEKLKEDIDFDDDGLITNRVSYTYDDHFNLIEKFDSAELTTYYFEYDDKDRQLIEIKSDFAGTDTIMSYYDTDGLLRIDSIRAREHVTITRMDDHGNELEVWLLDEVGDTISYSESSFNERDLETENKYWDGQRLARHRSRVYNDAGEITEEKWYNASGTMRMNYINEYDRHGRLVKVSRFTDEVQDFHLDYAYSENQRSCTTYIPRVKTRITREVYTYHSTE